MTNQQRDKSIKELTELFEKARLLEIAKREKEQLEKELIESKPKQKFKI